MTSTVLTTRVGNTERLTAAGFTLDHLTAEVRAQLEDLTSGEIETLLDIKRRFAGDLPIDPTMFQGSSEY